MTMTHNGTQMQMEMMHHEMEMMQMQMEMTHQMQRTKCNAPTGQPHGHTRLMQHADEPNECSATQWRSIMKSKQMLHAARKKNHKCKQIGRAAMKKHCNKDVNKNAMQCKWRKGNQNSRKCSQRKQSRHDQKNTSTRMIKNAMQKAKTKRSMLSAQSSKASVKMTQECEEWQTKQSAHAQCPDQGISKQSCRCAKSSGVCEIWRHKALMLITQSKSTWEQHQALKLSAQSNQHMKRQSALAKRSIKSKQIQNK